MSDFTVPLTIGEKIMGTLRNYRHEILDAAGMIPVVGEAFDVVNGVLYLAEGEYVNAGLSLGSAIPFAGNVVAGGKYVKKGVGAASDLGKRLDNAVGNLSKKADELVEGCRTGCFTAGTQIVVGMDYVEDERGNLTTVYTTVNIEDIQVGDLVYSYNTLTDEVVQSVVTNTLHYNSDHLRYIEVIDENGIVQRFETTDVHPFWVENVDADDGRVVPEYVEEYDPVTGETIIIIHENTDGNAFGGYVCAGDLRVGDVCIGPNGERLTVISSQRESFPLGIDVYNLEVEGTNSYYVIANSGVYENGAAPVMVHNAVGERCGPNFTHFGKGREKQLANALGIDEKQIHAAKDFLKTKTRANMQNCPELAKGYKRVGENPDILIDLKTGELGFQQPLSTVPSGKRPQSVQLGINKSEIPGLH